MKEKLFKLLFPKKYEELWNLKVRSDFFSKVRREMLEVPEGMAIEDFISDLKKAATQPKPSMADLMRDSLGLPMVDFVQVDKDGEPPHYLHGLNEDQRAVFIGELSNIYRKPEFKAVINYWINLFGNYAVRNADKDPQPGRFGINGVACIRKSFENAHKEFMGLNNPDEDEEEDE